MTRKQQVLLPSLPVNRRHPLNAPPRERRRVREVAGGATAECAAVCCCVPCTVMDLVVLATYKVPAGLVKKAMHKRKQRRLQNKKKDNDALLLQQRPSSNVESGNVGPTLEEHLKKEEAAEKSEVAELEKEMWVQFNGTGFWRSSSQHQQQLQQQQQQQPQLQTGEFHRV